MPKYALELFDDENLGSSKNCPIKRYGVGDDDYISIPFKVYTGKEIRKAIDKWSFTYMNEFKERDRAVDKIKLLAELNL